MPLETRDRNPYWGASFRATPQQLDQTRKWVDQVLWGPPETPRSNHNRLPRDWRGFRDPKCNQFVWDALHAGGAPAGRVEGGRIPIAKDWGDPSSKVPGYSPVGGQPLPGDVVANGRHVGIFSPLPDGRPGTVSAATPDSRSGLPFGRVAHNDWDSGATKDE
jgi:hypothetical protein